MVDGSQDVVTVEKYNIPQKGTITVSKEGEVFSHVAESGGMYQPQYEVQGQPGAVYDITALEDIVTPDGTVHLKPVNWRPPSPQGAMGPLPRSRCIWAAIRFWSAPRRMAW